MPYAAYLLRAGLYDTCPGCGGAKTASAQKCRQCRSAATEKAACISCGNPTAGPHYVRCRTCYTAARLLKKCICVDCGKPTKQYASESFAKRCWPCEVERRRHYPSRFCTVEDCGRVHVAKGLCRTHYQAQYPRDQKGMRAGGSLIGRLKDWPCQLCGYSKMRSEAARLIAGGPYRPGNVMALCVRCHREVDAGLTPAPTPPTAEEILARVSATP